MATQLAEALDIFEQLQKVCQIAQGEWKALNELVDKEEYLDVDGVAKYMGIAKCAANKYMNLKTADNHASSARQHCFFTTYSERRDKQ